MKYRMTFGKNKQMIYSVYYARNTAYHVYKKNQELFAVGTKSIKCRIADTAYSTCNFRFPVHEPWDSQMDNIQGFYRNVL